jgi:phosphopantothenoylcysteine synthetase/decarboxylase
VYNNNSILFNSIICYLCAESTATRPITDTAQRKYNNNNDDNNNSNGQSQNSFQLQCSNNNDDDDDDDDNNNNRPKQSSTNLTDLIIIQFNSIYLCVKAQRPITS